jgi:hypothetical protein
MTLRAFPVTYAADVEAVASFWELLGFRRHVQLPPEGEPGYVGLVHSDYWRFAFLRAPNMATTMAIATSATVTTNP